MHVDTALQLEFPGLRVVELRVDVLSVKNHHADLELLKRKVSEETRGKLSLESLKDAPVYKAYRDFYWKIGIDPTKTRPAAEALARRVLGGKEIPRINTLVDACNLISLSTSISIAAFDADLLHPEALVLRRARAGEAFFGVGMDGSMTLEGVETVVEDTADRMLVANYPYRNGDRSKVTEATRHALLLMCGVPGIKEELLHSAGERCRVLLTELCR
jgi:DNA/RNA-binding domain of Phe-tRNA-synthetase-like protein